MRLFDKVISTGVRGEAPQILKSAAAAQQVVVLQADAIAEHFGSSPEIMWGPEMYPYATPPWETCFLEWNEPKTWRLGKKTTPGAPYEQSGMLIVYFDQAKHVQRLIYDSALKGHNQLVSGIESQIESFMVGYPFFCLRGIPCSLDVRVIVPMKKNGTVLRSAVTGEALSLAGSESQLLSSEIGDLAKIVFLAFTFANCSNVKLKDVTEEDQPSPKLRRRLKIPEIKRYTLEIAGHVSRPSHGRAGDTGVMPFHLCRGHFATYTAEKPMFGNPKLVGRYWHPPHMKGKKENGEVIKDYAIAE